MAATEHHEPVRADSERESRRKRQRARTIAMLVLAVIITVFAVLNLKQVKVNWIFGSGHAPLIIVIVISVLLGIFITYMADRVSRRKS